MPGCESAHGHAAAVQSSVLQLVTVCYADGFSLKYVEQDRCYKCVLGYSWEL